MLLISLQTFMLEVNVVFNGLCRYGSDKWERIKDVDTIGVDECKKNCLQLPSCSAYSYTENYVGNDCDLYSGGPYTYGKTVYDHSKCYVLNTGKNTSLPLYLMVLRMA